VSRRVELIEARGGGLRIWDREIEGLQYVVGADVAEGIVRDAGNVSRSQITTRDERDFSAAIVLEVQSGAHVASWHGLVEPHRYASILAAIGLMYNTAMIVPERNGPGIAVVHALVNTIRYPRLYVDKFFDPALRGDPEANIGWQTNRVSRKLLISRIHEWLEDKRATTRDAALLKEMRSVQLDRTGVERAQGLDKDDRVMALGMALQGRFELLTNHLQRKQQDKPLTEDQRHWIEVKKHLNEGDRSKHVRVHSGGYGSLPRITRDGCDVGHLAPGVGAGDRPPRVLPPVFRGGRLLP